MNQGHASVHLTGAVVDGLGESGQFTQIPWVKAQFVEKLNIDPFPGTFNLQVRESASLKALAELKRLKAIDIRPAEPGFCPARAFIVMVAGKVRGAIVIPLVDGYPPDKVEIVADVMIRKALSLGTGEQVDVEVLL